MRTAAQQKRDRRELLRQIAADHRAKDRRKLVELRAAIREAVATRKTRMTAAVQSCRTGRASLRERKKQLRAVRRIETNAILDDMVQAERGTCAAGKDEARQAPKRARGALKAERAAQRALRRQEKSLRSTRPGLKRTSARERAGESDDEVRRNIPDDLKVYFEKVKKQVKGSPRQSRTEAFLRMAEEHPGEVVNAQETDAERAILAMVREEHTLRKAMRDPKRYKVSRAELEAAPF